jgi:hypothetical protein
MFGVSMWGILFKPVGFKALKFCPDLYTGGELVGSNTTYTRHEFSDASSAVAHV